MMHFRLSLSTETSFGRGARSSCLSIRRYHPDNRFEQDGPHRLPTTLFKPIPPSEESAGIASPRPGPLSGWSAAFPADENFADRSDAAADRR
jgi:hypothetical protein